MTRASQKVLFTFHRVREQCEAGNPEAWRAFLNLYAPVCLRLLDIYSPAGSDGPPILEKTLRALSQNSFAPFRAMSRQSEREFLSELRALLLDTASADSRGLPQTRTLDLEKLGKLLEGLPLLHQEMLFFKLGGYTDATLEDMSRIAPGLAQQAFARLDPDYAAALRLEKDRCPWPGEWLCVLGDARAAKKEGCPQAYQFLRVQDGQVSWYDKEPLEKHVTGCLYCLERWTALREVAYWRRAAPPATDSQIERLLQILPSAAPPNRSLWQRLRRS